MYDAILKQVIETVLGLIAAALIPVVLSWWSMVRAKAQAAHLDGAFSAAEKLVAAAKQNGLYPRGEDMKKYAVAELQRLGFSASLADAMVEAAVKAMKDVEAAIAASPSSTPAQ